MNIAMAGGLVLLFALGVPIFISIGLSSAFALHFFSNIPLLVVAQKMFVGIDHFTLMAIPFFILAGNVMSAGGISRRLVDLAKSMIGGIQGGLACTCVLTCMFFASVSGSSVATTFAIGSILIPAMVKHGYPVPLATSIQASSAELGVLIPPSIPLILFGVATDTSIGQLFVAGIGPGILVGGGLMIFVAIWCRIKGIGKNDADNRLALFTALKSSVGALLMPIVVLGGIYGGIFTPTEASAVAVFYAAFLGIFVYKEMTIADIPDVLRKTVISTTVVMLIIAAAALFSFLISLSGLSNDVGAWFKDTIESRIGFLLAINLLLFIVGMFVETSAAILVLAPIFTPIAVAYGVDPVHFGVIVVVNLALGMFTPPLGVNLFAACQVAKTSIDKVFTSLIPFVLVVLVCLMMITYIPEISLLLRDLLYNI